MEVEGNLVGGRKERKKICPRRSRFGRKEVAGNLVCLQRQAVLS